MNYLDFLILCPLMVIAMERLFSSRVTFFLIIWFSWLFIYNVIINGLKFTECIVHKTNQKCVSSCVLYTDHFFTLVLMLVTIIDYYYHTLCGNASSIQDWIYRIWSTTIYKIMRHASGLDTLVFMILYV